MEKKSEKIVDHSRVLQAISEMTDPERLRNTVRNAKLKGVTEVADAAFDRLITVQPSQKPGTVEHDFWKTIFAFEEILREERGRAVRLTRTRQKIAKTGEKPTLADFANNNLPPEGLQMLVARNLTDLTGEAIVLRHADDFAPEVLAAARLRLMGAGVDVEGLAAKADA